MNNIFLKRILPTSSCLGGLTYYYLNNKEKTFTYKSLAKYQNDENGYYLSYKENVYDVTDFIYNHPGGADKIILATGGPVEPYWKNYPIHFNNNIKGILEPLKVGTLIDYNPEREQNIKDIYINDPYRINDYKFHNTRPCNAEMYNEYLTNNFLTPNQTFFIRNHNSVPAINMDNYNLSITDYLGYKKINLTVLDLKNKFYTNEIVSAIQCAGNRRKELNDIRETSGINWGGGAIGNAKWKGILVKDIIDYYYTSKELDSIKYVIAEGFDGVSVSIPIDKIYKNNVLLAIEMNGHILSRDHGFPIRIIAPGLPGIKSIKWLKSIRLSNTEADSVWQKGINYKILPPKFKSLEEINKEKLDLNKFPTIEDMPVQSYITKVKPCGINENLIEIDGYAYSGNGRNIEKVEVSLDQGKTWITCEIKNDLKQDKGKAWSWVIFTKVVNTDKYEVKNVISRATDIERNTQPLDINQLWNVRGLNNNSCHRYTV